MSGKMKRRKRDHKLPRDEDKRTDYQLIREQLKDMEEDEIRSDANH